MHFLFNYLLYIYCKTCTKLRSKHYNNRQYTNKKSSYCHNYTRDHMVAKSEKLALIEIILISESWTQPCLKILIFLYDFRKFFTPYKIWHISFLENLNFAFKIRILKKVDLMHSKKVNA
ncbi:hypothetical protein BpHYR1_045609 [Brachionus plicatilis]|uniref:Uncharacterized protein n=1 Tax=Brachionus plicatilis TaxID=10195 RepID=A0A3M7S6K8_BRAPC|nr:hypothetical protein BpHYR1_045609 [Brachionus plicatilis]